MAAALSALNAKIRSQPVLNYVCSTRKLALRDFTVALPPLKEWAIADSGLIHTRFLGPGIEFRYSRRCNCGHAKGS